jgi:oligogalacturonide transporter
MAQDTSDKLSLKTKIGYGMGDFYGGGSIVIIGFYYLYFLTDVVRVNAALAGWIFLVSKAWDAVSDPLMGMISDRTKSRWGRRRPYFLFGIPLIFISFVMIWYPVDFASEMYRFAYMIFSYIFFYTIITMVMIPYGALASELTLDYNERASLQSIRIFFSTVSSIICAVVPMEIVKLFPDVKTGYVVMATVIGLLFALPFVATFFSTRERKDFKPVIEPISIKLFVEPFRMRSFLYVQGMYLFAFVAMDALMTIVIYFMTYYLGQGDQTNYVLGTMLLLQVLTIPGYYWFCKVKSKKASYTVGAVIWIVSMFISLFIKPGMSIVYTYIFGALVGIGTGGVVVMIYAIFPDIPDIDELNSGERREGLYAGLFTFMRKLSSAFAVWLISNAIYFAGYKAPDKQVVDGVTQMVQQVQSPTFILMLRLIFVLVPVVFLLVCLWCAARYPLSPAVHARLKEYLNKRRGGADMQDPEMAREERELKQILIKG